MISTFNGCVLVLSVSFLLFVSVVCFCCLFVPSFLILQGGGGGGLAMMTRGTGRFACSY